MNWYTANKSGDQGLVICEDTGRNVAVTYDTNDAQIIAAAPAILAALHKAAMRWGDYMHFAERCGEPKDGKYLEQAREYRREIEDAIAAAGGAPTCDISTPTGEVEHQEKRIVVLLEGGLVQQVLSNDPSVRVAIVDQDIEGADPDDLETDIDGEEVYLAGAMVDTGDLDQRYVNWAFDRLDAQEAA